MVVSCSSVKFDKSQKDVCLGSSNNCTFNPNNTLTFDYTVTVPYPDNRVDILFVDDNSKSMMKDQQQLASRFSSFMSSIQKLDWQIGITTTDMRSGSQNYVGGKLVPFIDSSGNSVTSLLTKTTQSYSTLFQNTIQRPETINCIWYYTHGQPWNCDISGDERSIYAAITVMQQNPSGLLRSGAPLDIIIVSNEDERSYGGNTSIPDAVNYPMISGQDYPQDLVKLSNQMGKSVTVHSIIIKPGDSACLASEQNNAYNDSALTAPVYADLANATGGAVGSICAADYSSQLQFISNMIGTGAMDTIKDLPCVPSDGNVSLYNPSTATTPKVVTGVTTRSFSVTPSIAPGTTVRLVFNCASQN